jgi:hypothetical protein
MGLLKEKSSYRPTRGEILAAWAVTAASGMAVAVFVGLRLLGR